MTLLNSVAEPSRIIDATKGWSTLKKRWPNGSTTAKRLWTDPLRSWNIEYDGLTLAEFDALEAFFDDQSGAFGVFEFLDPHTGLTYNVSFAEDIIRRQNCVPNMRGLYKLSLRIDETR